MRKDDAIGTPVSFYFDMTLTILRCDQVDIAFNTTSANFIDIARGESATIALSPKDGSYPDGCDPTKYKFELVELEG